MTCKAHPPPATAYTYLIKAHWSTDATYTLLILAHPALAISWPIPLKYTRISAKDRAHPLLADITPIPPRRTLVLGAGGQLGTGLRATFPHADFRTRAELDITNPHALSAVPWREYDTIINAAAYTAVDAAETEPGRTTAWQVNAHAVAALARIATEHHLLLVHVSTDYVFDGTHDEHAEDEPFSPLNVYGQSKAAGDLAAATTPQHYILRTSWVIGDGPNFVRTMADLARRGAEPSVVDDQHGRLTFTDELARGIAHLIATGAPHGTYNLTNSGPVTTWHDIARDVFAATGRDPDGVRPVSTAEYVAGRGAVAARPRNSTLALDKIVATGFRPRPAAADEIAAVLAAGCR